MRNATRVLFTAFVSQIALLSAVAHAGTSAIEKFTVDPSVQQTIEAKTQESHEFLTLINIVPVPEQEGEKLGLGISGPIAGRTDTSGTTERPTTDPTSLENHPYRCEKTNSDTEITYAKLDMWAKFPNFQTLIRDMIIKRQGLDRMLIGFNGTSVAATTNKNTNPLLQDVNKGWLYQIRTNAAARHFNGRAGQGTVATNKIYIDPTGTVGTNVDYLSLDALVFDQVLLLDPWAQDDTELVCIVGRDLLHDKYFPIISEAGNTATEVEARDRILRSAKQIGGLPAVRVPGFPAGAILITRLDNLSIYWQEGTRRRAIEDKPSRDRILNFESWNEAYVVEDYGYAALLENITLGKKPA